MIEPSYLDKRIRKIPDFPQAGILFYDVTTLFEDAEAFKLVIDEMSQRYAGQAIDKVVGIEFLVNLSFLLGYEKLRERGHRANYLLNYNNEKIDYRGRA